MPREIIKQGKNFVRYADGTILAKNVRFSYPHVFEPSSVRNKDGTMSKPSYSLSGMAPKETHKDLKNEIVEMINELIQENKGKFKKGEKVELQSEKKFFRDGDKSNKIADAGHWVFSTRETPKHKPSVRGPDAKPLTEDDGQVYGGCWGNILLRPWFQDDEDYGKRVNANLVACQVTKGLDRAGNPRPGAEPFGQGRLSEDDIDDTFEAVEDDDDDGSYDEDEDDDHGL